MLTGKEEGLDGESLACGTTETTSSVAPGTRQQAFNDSLDSLIGKGNMGSSSSDLPKLQVANQDKASISGVVSSSSPVGASPPSVPSNASDAKKSGHGFGTSEGRRRGQSRRDVKKQGGKDVKKSIIQEHPTQVPSGIKSSNPVYWSALEAAETKKLTETILEFEKNKFRTKESPLVSHGGGVFGATEEVSNVYLATFTHSLAH